MNKAFVREPDNTDDYCPRCGSKGDPVRGDTLKSYLTDEQRDKVSEPAIFCPSPQCKVVYFDSFERTVLASEIDRPVYPKDTNAPMCACFGLTRKDIEREVQEGVKTRVKEIVEKSKSPDARCHKMAANGKSCIAYVQKYYLQCLNGHRE